MYDKLKRRFFLRRKNFLLFGVDPPASHRQRRKRPHPPAKRPLRREPLPVIASLARPIAFAAQSKPPTATATTNHISAVVPINCKNLSTRQTAISLKCPRGAIRRTFPSNGQFAASSVFQRRSPIGRGFRLNFRDWSRRRIALNCARFTRSSCSPAITGLSFR